MNHQQFPASQLPPTQPYAYNVPPTYAYNASPSRLYAFNTAPSQPYSYNGPRSQPMYAHNAALAQPHANNGPPSQLYAYNQDTQTELTEEDRTVKGFRPGIRLLPHQVIGKTWMRIREDPVAKRQGGILADDMGLGKTIQTLTRIVEGKPARSDQDAGWADTTLIICPLALLGQWASEIKKMCVDLTVVEHHGPSRTSDPLALSRAHVVLTTYDILKSEHALVDPAPAIKPKSTSVVGGNSDEGDSSAEETGNLPAKNSKKRKTALTTKASISCAALNTKYRWVLTGTPLQYNVIELYSFFGFLRIRPYSKWEHWNEHIAKPIAKGHGGVRAMKQLQYVLKNVMLCRRKTDYVNGVPLINLPARNVEVMSCAFNEVEKTFYTALETKMDVVPQRLMARGGNYTSILVLLLRLRQACDHPSLVSKDYKKDIEGIDSTPVQDSKSTDAGANPDDLIAAFEKLGVARTCHMCQIELNSSNSSNKHTNKHCDVCLPLAARAEANDGSSAKIRAILQLLKDISDQSDGQEKTIISSQFTSMLDLIEPFLTERGVKFVQYDGSMTKEAREASLEKINAGLNLTCCNNVILVDIWWNPALEDQAFDRAHRMGQTRDVSIWKLKIDDTVEDRILALQDSKRALAAAALSGDKIKNLKLGRDDLLALFRSGGRDDRTTRKITRIEAYRARLSRLVV
ncbi:SNF2 family N-terminal domain-containing protein [Pterulicium gracile]|uniref:SNF2 family N-terminal domain-containing protein n=1 Tax=Pterulicium gracile TaxID=1884261 RepID=A0A5C3QPB6_9AGAR|nr:SNF2 family N-terminal domain-containing protein [Pterula gracilis]